VGPPRLQELGQAVVVEADDRGHGAVAPGGLHAQAALAHEAHAVGEGDHAGSHEGRVLAHRVAGEEGRLEGGPTRRGEGGLERAQVGDRGGQEGGLGVLRPIEVLGRAAESEGGDRLTERGVGLGEDDRGFRERGGERLAHAHGLRPLAGEDERDPCHRPHHTSASGPTRANACRHATIPRTR